MGKKFSIEELKDLTTVRGGKFEAITLHEAFQFCESLSKQHYENFPVGSILIPKPLRPHFYSIYAFSRIADDLGDETALYSTEKRLEMLKSFEQLLFEKNSTNPIFRALHNTLDTYSIPTEPFIRLIEAFRSDIVFSGFDNFESLYQYCHCSANPVGELLLRLFGEWNKETSSFSNDICTALQLLNFWQDFSRDFPNGRWYIPTEVMEIYSLSKDSDTLIGTEKDKQRALDFLFQTTNQLFLQGIRLLSSIKSTRLRMELSLILGSAKTVQQIAMNYGTSLFTKRPKLQLTDFLPVIHRSLKVYNTI
ncbi:MAG: squalene/phytoene synthase family protein [Candidatus Kapabacteria bacterium]|nr:squalene/phytoene synthase family protein [Candidatus Kapabacteria bacterium]